MYYRAVYVQGNTSSLLKILLHLVCRCLCRIGSILVVGFLLLISKQHFLVLVLVDRVEFF
jgi:hypothetical protein